MLHEDGSTRPCSYGDMAILLRSRTHLSAFEDALRNKEIPFVVVKGIGFYNAPEVAIMKSLLFFLIDPSDDYSLVNILRSPLSSTTDSVLSLIRPGPFPEAENTRPTARTGNLQLFIYPVLKNIRRQCSCRPGQEDCGTKNMDMNMDKVKAAGPHKLMARNVRRLLFDYP